ncbi:hypothetical protein AAC03nite_12410 [Alicyclobacillus acidoterrestris]|uniref:hypothetical protein n=1 Tax=Alicyclobacillus suci TaxID=2816080 RepID=UPI0011957FF0|nr:hypothetical protein [Alicyclobacillus suci]GEO25456.1 hypothetical protein AAC03nite_12410 [Alicyclobacillus acidoterrestris]
MQQYSGNPFGSSNQAQGGFNTLRQFGTDPQQVRQHISETINQGQQQFSGYAQQMAGQGYPQQFAGQGFHSGMRAGATNPQEVRQHIAQDLGYSNMNQMSASGFQSAPAHYSVMQAGATNPQEVRQHIAQDLGYGGQQFASSPMHAGATDPQVAQQHIAQDLGYRNASYGPQEQYGGHYNQGAFQQVMQSAPAQVQGNQGQQVGQFQGGYGQAMYGQSANNSAFGQFGTNVQEVRQDIQQDLSNQVGAMTSQQAGALRGQYGGSSQGFSQGQAMNSAFGQFGTNPQTVRGHISQDLNNFQ